MNGINGKLLSIEQATDLFLHNQALPLTQVEETDSFQSILESKVNVKFSKHANERLESRNIILSNEQINRLNEGVDRARDKQIKESLVMMDDLAFIVNVKNNTVVTALEQKDDGVFTNIDGAVIV